MNQNDIAKKSSIFMISMLTFKFCLEHPTAVQTWVTQVLWFSAFVFVNEDTNFLPNEIETKIK